MMEYYRCGSVCGTIDSKGKMSGKGQGRNRGELHWTNEKFNVDDGDADIQRLVLPPGSYVAKSPG